ncbi:hypothetical protein [Mesorhizobium qingshengii]|uniref:Uncharacterized protein n=1 Tax=Mesorhizobium qingshengii TaxID=1165689 RepID=A0A1G5ZBD6_9HYPH|nr:hypothetical protein [Mesorhizobium qingshengii]SDA92114.1 hypothetical protein SAMN02927914_04656 [Mesorhizobium qingshengii]
MEFVKCNVPYAENGDIQDQFERLFVAYGCPEEMALICRTTEDRKAVVYLLTPTASELYGQIPAIWESAHDVANHRWMFLAGHEKTRIAYASLQN